MSVIMLPIKLSNRSLRSVFMGVAVVVSGLAQAGPSFSTSRIHPEVAVERLRPELDAIISPSAQVKSRHLDPKGFFEGPTWIAGNPGYLVFSDIPGNSIWRLDAAGKPRIFLKDIQSTVLDDVLINPDTHRRMIGPNGTTLDPSGRLTYCVFGGRRIEQIDRHGNRVIVLSSIGTGPPIYPNDLVYRSDGSLYFSEKSALYRFAKGRAEKLDGPANPNGMAFSPDEKYLYATDHPSMLRRYDVAADGTLGNSTVFFDLSLDPTFDPKKNFVDGVKVDKFGNVFAVGGAGVWILSPNGIHIGTIRAPVARFSNLAFGGRNGDILFLTAPEGLYSIDLASSRMDVLKYPKVRSQPAK